MKYNRQRAEFWALKVLTGLMLLASAAAPSYAVAADSPDDSDVEQSIRELSQVLGIVEQNYADPVDADRTIYGPPNSSLGAIQGMLRTLDPHSNFFDPRAYAQLREDREGKYFGVG